MAEEIPEVSEAQFEAIRKYLDEDAQSHIKAHGKWGLDAGKLEAAFQSAGFVVAEPEDVAERERLKDVYVTLVTAAIIDDAETCTSYKEEISLLVRRRAELMSNAELLGEIEERQEQAEEDDVDE